MRWPLLALLIAASSLPRRSLCAGDDELHAVAGLPALVAFGLFAPRSEESSASALASRGAALHAAVAALRGLPPIRLPADAVVEVPQPGAVDWQHDARISLTARATLGAHGSRRSRADLGSVRAAALYLAHADAWQRLLASGAAAALVIVDPESVLPRQPAAAAGDDGAAGGSSDGAEGALFWSALAATAPGWGLLLLSAVRAPTTTLPLARELTALRRLGWAEPRGSWTGLEAYIVSRAGARALLGVAGDAGDAAAAAAASNVRITCRVEAHIAALARLREMLVMWRAPSGGVLAGEGRAVPRREGWAEAWAARDGGGGGGPLLAEDVCDVCDLPDGYWRAGHILGVGGSAAIAGALAIALLRVARSRVAAVVIS